MNKADEAYNSISKLLKKGGILGVVQHRASENVKENFSKGYVKEDFLIKQIEKQGLKFIEKSEINSNPRDLKNYKKGVWSLPPRFSDGKKTKYLNIGESDRMTLKFIKL
jgi:predicted methyltransferase